jgi:small subunit ribosomal protein S16
LDTNERRELFHSHPHHSQYQYQDTTVSGNELTQPLGFHLLGNSLIIHNQDIENITDIKIMLNGHLFLHYDKSLINLFANGRDGKYLEKLGTYNPNTNPATINLDIDGSVKWLQNGAQPTDTARAILSYSGVMMKHHLAVGVRKGAMTEEQAEEKFNAWLEEKKQKIQDKKDGLSKAEAEARAKALEAEKEVSAKRAAAALPEEEVAEEAAEETAEAATEEATAEAPAEEEAPAAEEAAKEEE